MSVFSFCSFPDKHIDVRLLQSLFIISIIYSLFIFIYYLCFLLLFLLFVIMTLVGSELENHFIKKWPDISETTHHSTGVICLDWFELVFGF